MPILISNNLSNTVSKAVQYIENPNLPWGVLAEEVPSDVGRTYQSYKRGGVLEGLERFRRETLSAAVWLFGIPIFNWTGNKFFEKFMHIPVDMDYADETIEDVVKYLKENKNPKNLDVSELLKYKNNFKIKDCSAQELIKSIKKCKTVSTVSAVLLNCLMMGVVIPKFNQHLTKQKIEKMNKENAILKPASMDEFQKKTSKAPSFKGGLSFISDFKNLVSQFPYAVENNNTFRLVITDVPTLTGRAGTSRNKYEAMENLIIDGGSIYFYNFCANNVRKFLCSKTKIPTINPMVSKLFLEMDENTIKDAMEKIKGNKKLLVDEIFDKDTANQIYNYSTFGKYTKINRYVSKEQKEIIDNQVFNYLKSISEKMDFSSSKKINIEDFRKFTKIYNVKSAGFLALGLAIAVFGLSTLLPKLAFKITTFLTGKNEFTGIANFDEDKKSVKKS